MGTQQLIDQTHTVKPHLPIDIGNEPDTGDDIAYRNIGGRLPVMFVIDHRLEGIAEGFGFELQPFEGKGCRRIMIAQALDQLDGEGFGGDVLLKLLENRV